MSKRGHVDGERVELVVPAKGDDRANRRAVRARRRTPRAERGAAGGDVDAPIRRRSGAELVRQVVRLALVRVRQPPPHVEQRFLVHRLVFERGEDRLPVGHRGMLASGEVELGPLHRRHDLVVGSPRELEDRGARRPARAGAAARHGLLLAVGIDAAGEQRLEAFVDAGAAQPALQKRDDAEGRQVSFIEHDGIAQRDRPREVHVRDRSDRTARANAGGSGGTSRTRPWRDDNGATETVITPPAVSAHPSCASSPRASWRPCLSWPCPRGWRGGAP